VRAVPLADPALHVREVLAALQTPMPPRPAPVLLLPRVFEPEFCRMLMALYDRGESAESGFMQTDPKTGKTVLRTDPQMKRRRDCLIEDEGLQKAIRRRLHRRLVPEVRKAFQFHATRIERYIVARYDAADGGHFRAHRDNTTKGTAHRRFAVTINLNADDYEGGDLAFPEFGPQTFRAPTGGAVVFSCSLLHEARPVTRGARYCFLPFLYDEAAAKIRQENLGFVDLPKG
jgi:predicted 2-oxoglutarate/Fe(II)-dependent dioxygenase YbiX